MADQGFVWRKLVGDGVDADDIQSFFDSEAGKDAGHGTGDEGLAGAGRAAHQHVVTPGSSDFQGSLHMLLTLIPVKTNDKGV